MTFQDALQFMAYDAYRPQPAEIILLPNVEVQQWADSFSQMPLEVPLCRVCGRQDGSGDGQLCEGCERQFDEVED